MSLDKSTLIALSVISIGAAYTLTPAPAHAEGSGRLGYICMAIDYCDSVSHGEYSAACQYEYGSTSFSYGGLCRQGECDTGETQIACAS